MQEKGEKAGANGKKLTQDWAANNLPKTKSAAAPNRMSKAYPMTC
ncbi:MAG: hypothetical protein OHK0037_22800 [Elainellaceae cyanobacterium]